LVRGLFYSVGGVLRGGLGGSGNLGGGGGGGGSIQGAPIVVDKTVYLASESGEVYALE